MICPHCGENNPDNSKYCSRCSATLPRKSRSSGSAKPTGSGIDGKTVIIIILIVLLVIGAVIFIRSKVSSSSSEEVSEEVSEEETEEESEEETEETTEEESEETAEEEKSDWTKDKGLTVEETDKTSFSFKTMKVKADKDDDDEEDDSNDDDKDDETEEEFEVSSKITISESTENAPDGYKLVSATFLHDVSESEGDSGVIADGAFDRYTGTFFGFEDERPDQDDDNKADLDGFVRVTDGDDHYDIAVMSEIDVNNSSVKKTITVICPEDYDGTVFYAGYSSKKLDEKLKGMDFSEKLYTFEELPFMDDGHDMYYFNYKKADSTGRSSWGTYEVEEEPVQETGSGSQRSGPPQ